MTTSTHSFIVFITILILAPISQRSTSACSLIPYTEKLSTGEILYFGYYATISSIPDTIPSDSLLKELYNHYSNNKYVFIATVDSVLRYTHPVDPDVHMIPSGYDSIHVIIENMIKGDIVLNDFWYNAIIDGYEIDYSDLENMRFIAFTNSIKDVEGGVTPFNLNLTVGPKARVDCDEPNGYFIIEDEIHKLGYLPFHPYNSYYAIVEWDNMPDFTANLEDFLILVDSTSTTSIKYRGEKLTSKKISTFLNDKYGSDDIYSILGKKMRHNIYGTTKQVYIHINK